MTVRNLVVSGAALLVSISAAAQAGPQAQKSSDQIICEISGDCSAVDSSLATKEQGATRGFRIVGPSNGANASPAAKASSSTHLVTSPAATSAPRSITRPRSVARGIGHSDLAINFQMGSSALTESGKSQASEFLKAMSSPQLAGKRFKVIGHTDSVGGKDYNLDLSRKRAAAVVDYLVQSGASRDKLDPEGVGFSDPVDRAHPAAAANRRVEFVPVSR
jgi:outer membrane protein OmpA-like peptidoglycan-associated protein